MTLRKGVAALAVGALVVLAAATPAHASTSAGRVKLAAAAATTKTITENYTGPSDGCNYLGEYLDIDLSRWDKAWVYELTGVGGENGVVPPKTITVGLTNRAGARTTQQVGIDLVFADGEDYPANTAFYALYPGTFTGTPDATASAVVDSSWDTEYELFDLLSMPCDRPTLTVAPQAVSANAGQQFTIKGTLKTAGGAGFAGQEIGAYFFPGTSADTVRVAVDIPATKTTQTDKNGDFSFSLTAGQSGSYTIWYDGIDELPAPGQYYAADYVQLSVGGAPATSGTPVTSGPVVVTTPPATTAGPVVTTGAPVVTEPPATTPEPETSPSTEAPQSPVETSGPPTTTAPPVVVTSGPVTTTGAPATTAGPPVITTGPPTTTAPPTDEPPVIDPPVGPTLPDTLPESDGPLVLPGGTTVRAGSDVVITGGGFKPNTPVTIGIYSQPQVLGTTKSNGDGEIRAVVTIPEDLSGDHTIVAAGDDGIGGIRYLTVGVSIEEAIGSGGSGGSGSGSGSGGGLPITGVAVAGISTGGLLLVAAGFMLYMVARRRRLELAPATAPALDETTQLEAVPVSDAVTQVDIPAQSDAKDD